MRHYKALLLAAAVTAALPALAWAQPPQNDQDHPARDHQGGDRGDRGDRGATPRPDQQGQRAPQPQPAPPAPQAQPQAQPQPQAQQRPDQVRPNNGNDRRGYQGNNGDPRFQPNGQPRQFQPGNQRPQDFRPDDRRPDFRGNDDRRPGFRPGGPGGQRPDFRPGPGGFAHDWRNDRRYDWHGYRDQHREAFRAPRYIAPRGWGFGYRPFSIGVQLPGFFLGQQYWISDPWAYRLPPVDGPYRWVRYFNDVLLIDLRSGVVVDEIPNFFF